MHPPVVNGGALMVHECCKRSESCMGSAHLQDPVHDEGNLQTICSRRGGELEESCFSEIITTSPGILSSALRPPSSRDMYIKNIAFRK